MQQEPRIDNARRPMTRKGLVIALCTLAFLVALVVVANVWSRVIAGAIGAAAVAALFVATPRAVWRNLAAKQKEREKTTGGKVLRWAEWLVLGGILVSVLTRLAARYP
jgi:hypothetical protein